MKPLKAIIMAGGEGSRLRPLTCDCPKPMLPLMGRPLMEYAVELLKAHGISEIAATLGYLPDFITDYFGDGENAGVQLHYYIEKTPLGTAGSVKQAQSFLDERFIVLSGDGITDFDLSAALRFHAEKGALATLLLKKHSNPQEYGMVVTAPDGRIRSFHEKPGRSDVYSDLINTGIYILEPEILSHIPETIPYDFGHDLFPALVALGLPVYGCVCDGYWCDVGDVAAYLRVHADALDGRMHLPGLPASGADRFVGENVQIHPGAHIGAYTVIGEDCSIASGADIKRSILLPGTRIEAGAQLRGCIVGKNAVIGEGAQLFEESVVGSGSRIGARASLPPGVKLWPKKSLPEGEHPDANIVWGLRREQRFISGALQLETPAQAARAAQACMAEMKPREVILGRDSSAMAAAMWHAAAAGIMAQGVQAVDAGVCSPAQLRHAREMLHGDSALLVCADSMLPLNSMGACLNERQQKAILRLLERQDFARPFSGITPPMADGGNTAASYAACTAAAFTADSLCAPGIVCCASRPAVQELAERIFVRAGLRMRWEYEAEHLRPQPGEIGIHLPDGGETAVLFDGPRPLDEAQRQLACAWAALEDGAQRLILPVNATRTIETLAEKYGAQAIFLPGERAAWMHALAEKEPRQLQLQFDGLYFALRFISLLTDRGLSLGQWLRRMPAANRMSLGVQVPFTESGRLLHALAQAEPRAELGGGVRLPRKGGWVWLGPDESGAALNIIAESADMETSRELCDFYSGEIRRLLPAQD